MAVFHSIIDQAQDQVLIIDLGRRGACERVGRFISVLYTYPTRTAIIMWSGGRDVRAAHAP